MEIDDGPMPREGNGHLPVVVLRRIFFLPRSRTSSILSSFPRSASPFLSPSFCVIVVTMSGGSSVVGIDLGYQNSLIAATARGGVDVILNGNSNRLNPYVSFLLCRAAALLVPRARLFCLCLLLWLGLALLPVSSFDFAPLVLLGAADRRVCLAGSRSCCFLV
jgi:hypothetical protein